MIMNRSLFLVFLGVLLISKVNAQDNAGFDLKSGEKYSVGICKVMFPIGRDNGNIYYHLAKESYYKAKKGFNIAKFDFQNQFILEKEIELTGSQKNSYFEFYNILNDTINLIYSFKNKDQKKTFFFRQTIDGKTLSINNNEKMILEVDWSDISSSQADDITYKLAFSPDSSKIALCYSFVNEKSKNKLYYGFAIMNNQYQVIWKDKKSTEDKVNTLTDIKVSNQGDAYLAIKTYNSLEDFNDSKHRTRVPGSDIFQRKLRLASQLYNTSIVLFQQNEDPISFNLSINKKHIKDLNFEPVQLKKILCTGFYTAIDSYDVEGAFSCLIAPDSPKNIEIEDAQKFEESFIKRGMSENEQKDYDKCKQEGLGYDLSDYRFKNMIHLPNGEYVSIAEQFFSYYIDGSNNMGSYSNGYHYGFDIFVTFIDSDGTIKKVSKIPKRQFDLVDLKLNPRKTFDGFQCTLSDDKLYFVFNDITNDNITFLMKIHTLVVVSVDMDGKMSKSLIPEYSKVSSNILVDKGIWINNHTLSFYGYLNTAYKIHPITLSIPD